MLLGLDDAGKTTLLYLLKEGKLIQPMPSMHATSEELVLGKITLTTYDLGGHKQVRKLWKEYFLAVDAVVFIIDVSKRSRFEEAKAELDSILDDENLMNSPILILGNKIDKYNVAGEKDIIEYFNLGYLLTGKVYKLLFNFVLEVKF